MIGPLRPPSRGSLDVLRLAEVGALCCGVVVFAVIVWATIGKVGVGL